MSISHVSHTPVSLLTNARWSKSRVCCCAMWFHVASQFARELSNTPLPPYLLPTPRLSWYPQGRAGACQKRRRNASHPMAWMSLINLGWMLGTVAILPASVTVRLVSSSRVLRMARKPFQRCASESPVPSQYLRFNRRRTCICRVYDCGVIRMKP